MRFSIIIPAFNSASYIKRALDSIKEQTFEDYELIVVCDSCIDNTKEIAEQYADKVYEVDFHQDGFTRNVGIDHADGEYLLFMDDDDWWMHENVLEKIDNALNDCDVLRFGFYWQMRGYCPPDNYYACWEKAWRREFVGDSRFSDVDKCSDVDFYNSVMWKHPRIKDLDECLYYYNYLREGSQSWEVES